MSEPPAGRGGGARDPERALLFALRCALIPTLCVPLASASAAASATGEGLPFAWAGPLVTLALIVSVACWLKVITLRRALRRPGDDDQEWWRWQSSGAPLDPGGGSGGISFDWATFEREFWSHVKGKELQRETAMIHA
jgi:hypothetical protein